MSSLPVARSIHDFVYGLLSPKIQFTTRMYYDTYYVSCTIVSAVIMSDSKLKKHAPFIRTLAKLIEQRDDLNNFTLTKEEFLSHSDLPESTWPGHVYELSPLMLFRNAAKAEVDPKNLAGRGQSRISRRTSSTSA